MLGRRLLMGAANRGGVTWNPLDKAVSLTLSGGNLTATASVGTTRGVRATSYMNAPIKNYFEILLNQQNGLFDIGVATSAVNVDSGAGLDQTGGLAYRSTGSLVNGTTVTGGWGSSYTTGDTIGIAFNQVGTGGGWSIWFAKNNTWQASGNPSAGTNAAITGTGGTYSPALFLTTLASQGTAHFALASWTYAPPTAYTPVV